MAKELKVFGGGWHGEERRIVAATSITKALALSGCGRGYMCETRNPLELEVALANPGVVYAHSTRETMSPKVVSDFKIITDKSYRIGQQRSSTESGN